jgi:hypothetical protein
MCNADANTQGVGVGGCGGGGLSLGTKQLLQSSVELL